MTKSDSLKEYEPVELTVNDIRLYWIITKDENTGDKFYETHKIWHRVIIENYHGDVRMHVRSNINDDLISMHIYKSVRSAKQSAKRYLLKNEPPQAWEDCLTNEDIICGRD